MIDTLALVFGIIYLAVGGMGLVIAPGGGLLFGIFEVSPFHHLFHLGIGLLGIVAGWKKQGRLYCRLVGGVLIFLGILGFLAPGAVGALIAFPTANLLTDNMLHLVTGIILGYFGLVAPATPAQTGKAALN
jgi:hypothetical protein